jgi:hypothetical protein
MCAMLTGRDAAAISSSLALVGMLWDLLTMGVSLDRPEW